MLKDVNMADKKGKTMKWSYSVKLLNQKKPSFGHLSLPEVILGKRSGFILMYLKEINQEMRKGI